MSRVWFVTGASSGFGKDLAEAVLARGDRAIVTARRAGPLTELEQQHGDAVLAVVADVTGPTDRAAAVHAALERFGRIDVLANIAGQGSFGAVEEFSIGQLRQQMELNFFAAAELTRAVLPTLRAQGSGHILNLTSIGGLTTLQGFGAYSASKFALEGWSEALAAEVAPLGLRVTIVEPGGFRTEFAGPVNLRPAGRIDAYGSVLAPIEEMVFGADVQPAGDPRKAAAAMIAVVESPEPPLRLLLGADAISAWETKRDAVTAEVAAWRNIGENTAHEGRSGPAPAVS